ncbi:MAG: aminopeptidase P family protein [Deltaproteobacteria bacterium]|nr:aminopeptidase P family protein [Deltaproteobacteria bacterium]
MDGHVPPGELRDRVGRLQQLMAEEGLDLGLVRQPADLFYYSGTVVDGFLAVPAAGAPRLLVRRPQARQAAADSPFALALYADLREVPDLTAAMGFPADGLLGLELDVLPAAFYLQTRDQLFPGAHIRDLSPLVRRQRMVKSAWEIERLRRAAAVQDQVMATAPELLRPGVSELELSAALEYRLRLLGHQGLVRLRRWDLELFFGHVLSGVSGLELAYVDTPSGGLGFSPAFPQGPSHKALAPGEPISIDLAACLNGYLADMTRLFAIHHLPPAAWEAFAVVRQLYALFEEAARPGVMPGELFQALWDEVRQRGWADRFMGVGPERVKYLGHGVGLELDEFPILAARFPLPLEAGMVLAFEPKFFLPNIGMVGMEDTGVITDGGVEWLTRTPREIVVV